MVSIGMVAYRNEGQDYASDYARSILEHEPGVKITMLDSGSNPPYRKTKGFDVVRMKYPEGEQYNYAKCLNALIKNMTGDWLIYGNDDVLCTGKFVDVVEGLDKKVLWGVDLAENRYLLPGVPIYYVTGWLVVMHRNLLEKIGWYDENLAGGNMEDIDYSYRAVQSLVPVNEVKLPFVHLNSLRRKTAEGYRANALDNRKYFLQKNGRVNG